MNTEHSVKVLFLDGQPSWANLSKMGIPLTQDWHRTEISPPAHYLITVSDSHLHFLIGREKAALSHPEGTSGRYQAELWRYDVGELFLASKDLSYLELNLSPSGAWWSCHFQKARVPARGEPRALKEVKTIQQETASGWRAMASIPLSELPDLNDATANVCFILNSPEQRFLTISAPSPGAPDFHRPEAFLPLKAMEV